MLAHDAEAQLGKIRAPTQITFGRHDIVTSTRFADRLKNGIKNSELYIVQDCSHAALYENVRAGLLARLIPRYWATPWSNRRHAVRLVSFPPRIVGRWNRTPFEGSSRR